MSLINDMLKDLEQRNASAETVSPMLGEVRSAAPAPRNTKPVWLLLALALVGLAAGAYVWQQQRPVVAKPARVAAVVPVKPKPPQPAPVPPPASVPAPTETAPMPLALLPGLDRQLSMVPVATSEPNRVPAPSRKAAGGDRAASVSSGIEGTAAAAGKAAPAKPAGKAVANLPIKQMSAQQRSDNAYRQAVTLIQQGRVAEAQENLQQAVTANPANHDARQLLAGLLVDSRRGAEAAQLLREGLALAPEQIGFAMALAHLQVGNGEHQAARATLEQSLVHAGDDAEYHAFLAALLQREERHEEAAQHYLVALRTNPAMPNWLVGVGISWQAQNMLGDAADAYQRALDTAQLTPELAQFTLQRLKQIRP